jgi:hypothetical protein
MLSRCAARIPLGPGSDPALLVIVPEAAQEITRIPLLGGGVALICEEGLGMCDAVVVQPGA